MKLVSLAFIIALPGILNAQHSMPDTVVAFFTNNKIEFDGKLNDPGWAEARRISNFTQRELNFGQPCSEKTEVAITRLSLSYFAYFSRLATI